MVDQKPNRSVKAVLTRAIDEAAERRATNVEAEHLLLALAGAEGKDAARVLTEAGLSHDAIGAALDRERAESLAAAGIGPVDENRLVAAPRQARPGWGTSTREAIARWKKASGQEKRPRPVEIDMLIGILQASLGTVPRALAIAGIDRADLIERARRA